MDLDAAADRLYALPPAEFTAARAAEVKVAKEGGDPALARAVGALRKPTVSAWAVNRAAREHPDELRELLDLGERLREAWAARDAGALAALTRERAEIVARVGGLVKRGLSAGAAAEVEQTLEAAVVDAGAAARVRAGRLEKALSYSGFAPAPAAPGPRQPAGKRTGAREQAEAAAARRARELEQASADYQEWRDALASAAEEHDRRAEKAARLEKKLARARKRLTDSQQRLEVTRREERLARARLDRLR
ncbi:hypothetical protein [Nonomuraea longicatena]|uniref:Transposase n=1 Tax=Nonomuraea longicatena TaxID=83682 RepID=A0ABN1P005_9ACTN